MNPLASRDTLPHALLALEDGSSYYGFACGAMGEAFGEVVFNTSMVGYQEIVTDPSYAGQIVTLTYPQVGNYGVSDEAMQSTGTALKGLVVRDMCHTPSHWQSLGSFPDFLRAHLAIEGVDTRALTLRIRSSGAMRAAISTVDLDPESLVARVAASPAISAHNYVADVSPRQERKLAACSFSAVESPEEPLRVVAFDCGEKRGIEKGLVAAGCEVIAVPFDTPASRVRALSPDGVFFSNGPGDPNQVTQTACAACDLLGTVPVFGICLGHQLISMAAGAQIEKLPFGHHGGNEPVMNLLTHRVEITSQNHNYGLVFESMGLGHLVGILFFVLVLFAALTSSISLAETSVSTLQDELGWTRTKGVAFMAVLVLVLGSLSSLGFGVLSNITILGMDILDFFDFLTNSIMMPIAAFAVCLLVSKMGIDKIAGEVKLSSRFRFEGMYRVFVRTVAPVFVAVILFSSIASVLGWIKI